MARQDFVRNIEYLLSKGYEITIGDNLDKTGFDIDVDHDIISDFHEEYNVKCWKRAINRIADKVKGN